MRGRERPDRRDDGGMRVADHTGLGQVDAGAGQFTRQVPEIGIAGAAGEDLVPITSIAALGLAIGASSDALRVKV